MNSTHPVEQLGRNAQQGRLDFGGIGDDASGEYGEVSVAAIRPPVSDSAVPADAPRRPSKLIASPASEVSSEPVSAPWFTDRPGLARGARRLAEARGLVGSRSGRGW